MLLFSSIYFFKYSCWSPTPYSSFSSYPATPVNSYIADSSLFSEIWCFPSICFIPKNSARATWLGLSPLVEEDAMRSEVKSRSSLISLRFWTSALRNCSWRSRNWMSELTYGLTAVIDVVDSCFLEVSAFDGIVVSETVTVVSYYYL